MRRRSVSVALVFGLAATIAVASPTTPGLDLGRARAATAQSSTPADALNPSTGATTWFFAEGNALPNWFQYYTLVNPDPAAALPVTIEYSTEFPNGKPGPSPTVTVTVPAGQRRTVPVYDQSGTDARLILTGVSAKLSAPRPFVAERPVYFQHRFPIGDVNGAHDVIGATAESDTWYFAEGSTLDGFRPYLTLFNARPLAVSATITYATEGPAGTEVRTLSLPPRSRTTIDIAGTGPGGLGTVATGVATTVAASGPIVAERPFYLNRDVGGTGVINGAHAEKGATLPSPDWSFAEGTVLPEFFEFITLYNPSGLTATVAVNYQLDGPSAAGTTARSVPVPPGGRRTIQVFNPTDPGGLGRDAGLAANPLSGGVSVTLKATNGVAFLAERPLYVSGRDFGSGPIEGAHNVYGFPGDGATRWLFAEGTVRPGFAEYLTLSNPGTEAVPVTIDYLVDGGSTVSRPLVLPPNRRTTVDVAGAGAQGGYGPPRESADADIGIRVTSTNGRPFIAERPIYVNRGLGGMAINDAHNVLGHPDQLPAGSPSDPVVTVTESDNKGFKLHVDFPAPRFGLLQGAGHDFAKLTMGGLAPSVGPDDPEGGTPELPAWRSMFAIPRGATPSVQVLGSSSYEVQGVFVAPAQDAANMRPNLFDDEFYRPPFAFEPASYQSDALLPPAQAAVTPMGMLRDIELGSIAIAGAQYRPASRRLTVMRTIDLKVSFAGGRGTFADERINHPFEWTWVEQYGIALNAAAIGKHLDVLTGPLQLCGVENVILTGTELTPAANALAAFRNSQGIFSRVHRVGTMQIPNTAVGIQGFLRGLYETPNCGIRPSYVTVFGDINIVTNSIESDGAGHFIGTDILYTLMTPGDLVPDIAHGRIPAQTLAEAMTFLSKVTGYELTPPASGSIFQPNPFYANHTVGASFEAGKLPTETMPGRDSAEGSFIAEQVHDLMVSKGFNSKRLYGITNGNQAGFPAIDPQQFNNGDPMPGAILKSNGFPWTSTAAEVTQAIVDGTFLFLHYDHAGFNGWSIPPFTSSHLSTFTNAALPVFISIDCSSGFYDMANGSQSHAEKLALKADGGAVGVVAHSRTSYWGDEYWPTTGYYDAMFPNFIPTFGGAAAKRRMGDVVLHGKLRSIAAQGSTTATIYLTHWLGDPTMQIHVEPPKKLDLDDFVLQRPIPQRIVIILSLPDPPPDGAIFTLLARNGSAVVGRGFAKAGRVEIDTGGFTGEATLGFDAKDWIPAGFAVNV